MNPFSISASVKDSDSIHSIAVMIPSTIIFLHLPKTAGTTLFDILEQAFPRHATFVTDPRKADFGLSELSRLSQSQRNKFKLIAGHMPFGVHNRFDHNAHYFTFLRDPIERSISDYYFVKKQPPTHYLHHHANSLSLEEYLEYRATISRDNVQTRLISGQWDTSAFDPGNLSMLEQAKENLKSCFLMIGLTERFDESLLVLKRCLGLPNIYYVPRNVMASRPRAETLSDKAMATARYYNQLDIALYAYGQELFESQVASYGPSLRDDLQSFQQRNRIVGRAFHSYWQFRRAVDTITAKVRL